MAGAWRIRSWPISAAIACRLTTVPTDVEVTALAHQDRERAKARALRTEFLGMAMGWGFRVT
eukprot:669284-Amphidinium_carterae.1